MISPLRVLPPVAAALAANRPVVALESSVLAQGLPIPANRAAAERMTAAVERSGSVAAITAVVDGALTAGLTSDELETFLRRDGVVKVSARDLAPAMVRRRNGATTVAATLKVAEMAGIDVFATGGIGGVHRRMANGSGGPLDESADLVELGRTSVVVVCAGAKSILDLPATWERLESLGITVVGYRTDEMPGFYTAETGIALGLRADSPEEIAELLHAERALDRPGALVVMQAPPESHRLDGAQVEGAVRRAVERASAAGITGAAVTPYLLGAVEEETQGASLEINLALLEANALLAGQVAAALKTVKGGRIGY